MHYRRRYYELLLSTFTTRDPAESDANLYRYCGNNPCDRVDPLGLWYIHRSSLNARALVIAEEGDDIAALAAAIGLDQSQYAEWLSIPEEGGHGYWTGSWEPAKGIPESASAPLGRGCAFEVPNTVFMFWFGDLGCAGKWSWFGLNTAWDTEVQYLSSIGFKVEAIELDTTEGAARIGSADALYQIVGDLSKDRKLHGVYLAGHGGAAEFGPGKKFVSKDPAAANLSFQYSGVKKVLEYDLALVVANACQSLGGATSLVSTNGIALGHEQWSAPTVFPRSLADSWSAQTTTPWHELSDKKTFPPGTQGTSHGGGLRRLP